MKRLHLTFITIAAAIALAATNGAFAHEGHEHKGKEAVGENKQEVTVKGEVVDMACYIDHNATGEKHADCARKCIGSGLPVGIKGDDGKTCLLIGEHKP